MTKQLGNGLNYMIPPLEQFECIAEWEVENDFIEIDFVISTVGGLRRYTQLER